MGGVKVWLVAALLLAACGSSGSMTPRDAAVTLDAMICSPGESAARCSRCGQYPDGGSAICPSDDTQSTQNCIYSEGCWACGPESVPRWGIVVFDCGGTPVLAIAPTSHDFGTVAVGDHSSTASFVVSNTGNAVSGTLSASLAGSPAFTLVSNGCSGTLAAGTSCTVVIQLTPNTAASVTATLNVAASPGGAQQVSLTGAGS